MSKRLNRLLIVDMAEDASRQFSRIGHRLGYTTESVLSRDEFITALTEFLPSVVLIDLLSVENGGLDHLKALRDQGSDAQIILTSDSNQRALETAKQLAEFLGLHVVANPRSSIFINVLRNELRKARQSQTELTLPELQNALQNGEIRPYYQPKACHQAQNGWPVTEVEALPRWHRSDNDVIMPDDFYWLAEEGGLLPALTNNLLDQVVEQMANWQQRKIKLNVAVKLPASSLIDRDFPDAMFSRVRAGRLVASTLMLEVSEANAMNSATSAIEVLGRLKAMEFRLAVDEFGTSYSSLEQLYRLQVDELIIDKSLVLESRTSKTARTVIEATVAFAHKLGLSVCADGVDSQRTLRFLGEIGCNKAQGNYISGPLLANILEDRLQDWRVAA